MLLQKGADIVQRLFCVLTNRAAQFVHANVSKNRSMKERGTTITNCY